MRYEFGGGIVVLLQIKTKCYNTSCTCWTNADSRHVIICKIQTVPDNCWLTARNYLYAPVTGICGNQKKGADYSQWLSDESCDLVTHTVHNNRNATATHDSCSCTTTLYTKTYYRRSGWGFQSMHYINVRGVEGSCVFHKCGQFL